MSKNAFGRDEMNALLGGGAASEEIAAFRPPVQQPGRDTKKKRPNEDPDISKMTAAETAALLMEKSSTAGTKLSSTSRYRTKKTLVYHELAKELSQELEVKQARVFKQQQNEQVGDDDEGQESDDDDGFMARATSAKRERVDAQVLVVSRSKQEEPKAVVPQKRRVYDDSSSSSSDSDSSKRRRTSRRRQQDSDDDSSSDEEDDRRRLRLLASKTREEPEVLIPKPRAEVVAKKEEIHSQHTGVEASAPSAREETKERVPKPKRQESSGSSSEESGDDSSSDDSSSESSEDEQVMAKPVFVPKHKRKLVQSEEKKWEEEEANLQREKDRAEKRKMESRAIVAQQAAAVDASANDEDVDEEEGGATNAAPNADDDVDREEARDAWEMRELERLLTAMDQQRQREMEQLEYQRRRQMTDAECLQEDIKTKRYQAPGSSRQGEPTGKGTQRFYHRGAYYMDEEEWDESDVRHKAAEYAKAATGEDKIDKSQLPEVMQVKNFGLARQNTRYKGLTKEDTTDKGFKMLPLVRNKKG